jgi:hypothetical protein
MATVPKIVVPSTKVTDPVVILRTSPTPFTATVRVIRRPNGAVLNRVVKSVIEAKAPRSGAGVGAGVGVGVGGNTGSCVGGRLVMGG